MPELRRHEEAIHFDVKGEGDQAIVLLHNLMCDREIWTAQVARLRDRYRVISVDVRGHGQSTAHQPFTIRDLVEDTSAILDSLALSSAIFVGLSIGASIAAELALSKPECVRGLVLMSPCMVPATRMDSIRNVLFAETVKAIGMKRELVRQVSGYLFGKSFHAESPEVIAHWEEKICAATPAFASHALRAWNKRERVLERLSAIRAPTLIVVGEEDVANPPHFGEEALKHMKGAELTRVPRAGHTMSVERPDEINAIIDDFAANLP